MLNNPKFSIIVPSHNGENHIEKCLNSIKSQQFTDYELIVVCDSCTDKTEEIAKKYTSNVYSVNYKRDGLTRNVGLDHARGEWILFLDDDDWWLHEYVLDKIYNTLSPFSDIIFYSFIWKGNGYRVQTKQMHYVAVWNKCWRRSFIDNTRFTDIPNWSDADFDREMMNKSPRCAYFDIPIYYYNFMREGSINYKAAYEGK